MEKLKNLINPGSKKDDEVMYGSGNMPGDPVHSGQSGQGSHFDSSRTTGNDPLSSSTNPTSTSATGAGYGNDPMSTPTSGQGSHGLNEPYASRMPGGFDDDAATTASVRSGIPGQSQSGSNIMDSNDPSLNKPLPREPTSAGTDMGTSSMAGNSYDSQPMGSHVGRDAALLGAGGVGTNSMTGNSYDSQPTSSHVGRDAALGTGAVGAGSIAHHRHEEAQRDNYAPETGRSFPLGGSSNDPNYGSGRSGTYPAGGAAGPHSSNLANKADPRVDSDLDGSRTAGSTGYGSSGADTGYGSGTGATPNSANQGFLGRADGGNKAGTTSSGTTSSGYGPESWEHEHNRHGHQYEGDPCETGAVGSGDHILGTTGPHITDTANLLDPHVASGTGRSEHTSHRHGEEAALAGSAGGAGLGAYEGSSSTGAGLVSPNTGSTSGMANTGTSEPYSSSTLSGRDNHLGRDSANTGTTSGIGSSDPYSSLGIDPRTDSSRDTTGRHGDHHLGRDAALGAGAGGLAYEAERHHGKPTQSSTIPSDTTSSYGNTRDPTSHDQAGTLLAGSGHQPATSRHQYSEGAPSETATNERSHKSHGLFGHHKEKDAAVAGGAGGAGYEAEKLHKSGRVDPGTQVREHEHPGASLATYPSPGYGHERDTTSHGHHTARDAALGGAALGSTGYEAERIRDPQSSHNVDQRSHGLDRTAEPTHGHHTGRDTALGGAALGGAGYEAERIRDPQSSQGVNQGLGRTADHDPSRDFDPSSNYAHDKHTQDPTRGHHAGRNAAGGAGAGALAGHELSEKDAKHLQKEHTKEDKALEKEHSKDIKHHDKEVAKHEKAIEKDEKKHEKAMEKEEKKHDHGSEKKHGGLLGLFHREKPDPQLKEDEARRQAQLSGNAGTGATSRGFEDDPLDRTADAQGFGRAAPGGIEGTSGGLAPAGATSLEDRGMQSGAGNTGIGSGPTTHDAYDNDPNRYNKLHKDPPAKVLESRGL